MVSQPIYDPALRVWPLKTRHARLHIKDVVGSIHMTGAPLGKVWWQPG